MKRLALLALLPACAAHRSGAVPGDDDGPGVDASVDARPPDDRMPDAPPVTACTTADWSIETIDQYHPSDGATAPLQPYIRSGSAGLEVAYATNPSGGQQRKLAVRSPAGTWSFAIEGTRVCGTVARGFDSHGVEVECSSDGPAVVTSTSQVVFSCGTRVAGGSWTTTPLGSDAVSANPSLVIDRVDRTHVTYQLGATDYYAWRDPGGAWTTETFGAHSAQYSPLAVDAAGCVHIARVIRDTGFPAYAVMHGTRCQGATAWTWETVIRENAFHWLGAHALAFDTLGRLHLVYLGRSTGTGLYDNALMHAVRASGGGWTVGLADNGKDPIIGSDAVAPDGTGGVWIGYDEKLADYNSAFKFDAVVLHVRADGVTERHAFGPRLYGGSVVPFVDPSGQVHVLVDSDWKKLEYATMCPMPAIR